MEASNLDHQRAAMRSALPQIGDLIYLEEGDQAPWRMYLDFGTFGSADTATVRIEIEVIGTGGEFIWQTSDEFDFSIQVDPKLHRSSLICNGMNQGHKSICLLDVPEGPWRARMSYTQQQGVNKQIRFMRVY
jgi:hypothetical protein